MKLPDPPAEIRAKIEQAPHDAQKGLWVLRDLILATGAALPEVGRIEECLKWGQVSFTTPETKSGSTLRIGVPKSGGFALYAHCQTNIIAHYQAAFPNLERIEANRAVMFDDTAQIEPDRLRILIAHALRYHL